ncbi:WS/DGAT domain-containing protein [Streptomyces radicis]|uniref:WS/DGAT domain-containing protein n=1 Tax=Streptomyces radicis TaxID=1750517 RepID=UPI0016009050|nr:WS/DGAT domain-containing protein [Streptomyces radicis]
MNAPASRATRAPHTVMTPAEGSMVAFDDRAGVPATIAAVLSFDGPCPDVAELGARVDERWSPLAALHRTIVPRPDGRPRRPYAWHAPGAPSPAARPRLVDAANGREGLAAHVGALLEEPLPPGGPLWGLDLLPGDNGFTLVLRAHHALLDGASVGTLLRALSDTPEVLPPPAGAPPLPPGRWARAGAALGSGRSAFPPGRALGFNRPVDQARSVAWAGVPMAEFEAARAALPGARATVNDVFLAAVAGALRRVVTDGASVRAMVPVNLRGPERHDEIGTVIGGARVALPVAMADPVARLRAVRDAMARTKRRYEPGGLTRLIDVLAVPAPGAAGALIGHLLGSPSLWNVLCSNIRLHDGPLEVAGRRLREAFVATCLPPRMGFVAVLTRYADACTVAFTSDGAHRALAAPLADAVREEVATLASGALPVAGP